MGISTAEELTMMIIGCVGLVILCGVGAGVYYFVVVKSEKVPNVGKYAKKKKKAQLDFDDVEMQQEN